MYLFPIRRPHDDRDHFYLLIYTEPLIYCQALIVGRHIKFVKLVFPGDSG